MGSHSTKQVANDMSDYQGRAVVARAEPQETKVAQVPLHHSASELGDS